ncbi:MAG: protease complex subunit PrcB family protein [Opitutaceae bacterium]|nr:protease complex subunit PrcB family protein [Opitutaceae bacterium]
MTLRYLVTLGAAILAGCGAQSIPAESPAAIITHWAGQHGGSEVPRTKVLRQAGDWTAFWQQVERASPRAFDPSREMAVTIEIGGKRTGGYSVEIVAVRREEGKLLVDYRQHTPDPDMMVTQALTSPWAIAVLPRSDLPLVFRDVGSTARRVHDK